MPENAYRLVFDLPEKRGSGGFNIPLDEDDLSNLHYIAFVYLKPIAEAGDSPLLF